jgi:hypothetical protein
MKIATITRSEFDRIPGIRQIICHEYAQIFACLDLGEVLGCYGLSWRSQLVELNIDRSTDKKMLWMGIEQQLAAICLESGRICLAMPLTANLIQMAIVREVTAVLTENEILLFNPNGSLRLNRGLSDVPEQFSAIDDNLVIELVEGDRFSLNVETGQFRKIVEEVISS